MSFYGFSDKIPRPFGFIFSNEKPVNIFFFLYHRSPKGEGGILFYLCPSLLRKMWRKMCIYMFNVYKNQLSQQTGSRNLMGPKTLPTIWYTYMMLVTKYQISAINSYWEKCDEKYLGRTEGRTEVKQYTPLPLRGAGV
jgi:hypothetical protein